jgi:hypothetical protein
MRKPAAIAAVLVSLCVLAGVAAALPTSDIYIWGTVTGRVSGTNDSRIEMTWAYKCLGDKLGYANYEWTLKVRRNRPLPRKVTVLAKGTSKKGSMTVRLAPGDYLPFSDPYFCETERGAGYDKPEIGAPFSVPDYCAWTVSAVRGAVQLEQGAAVKLARQGSKVAPGDALATPKGGSASIASAASDGKAALGGGARLGVGQSRCARAGGWRLAVAAGPVTVSVPKGARGTGRYETTTPNAGVFGGPGAGWRADYRAKATTVRVLTGSVQVTGRGAKPTRLKAGQSVKVRG